MDNEKIKSEESQENKEELFEKSIEKDPFSPENSFEDIKEAAVEKAEASLKQAETELENDLEVFSEAVDGEKDLVELEKIKNESQEKVVEAGQEFKTKLETFDSNKEAVPTTGDKNKAEKENGNIEKEKALKEVGLNFAALKALQKELKKASNPEEIAKLNEKITSKEKELKNSESIFEEALADEIENEIRNNPEANDLSHVENILIPGFSALADEKLKAVSVAENDPGFVNKALKFIGKYAPKSHLGKTVTVAAIVAGGAIVLGGTHGLPLAYALGSKIARSVAGSVIGEKVGEFVGKKMEQVSEKKKTKRLSEGLDGSIKTMIQLAQKEIEISAKQAKIRGMAKFGAHLLTAGGIMSGLKLAEYGVLGLLKQGAEHGVHAGIETSVGHGVKAGVEAGAEHGAHVADQASKDLSAYLLKKSSSALNYGVTFAPIDYVGDQFINKASNAHNPGGHH